MADLRQALYLLISKNRGACLSCLPTYQTTGTKPPVKGCFLNRGKKLMFKSADK